MSAGSVCNYVKSRLSLVKKTFRQLICQRSVFQMICFSSLNVHCNNMCLIEIDSKLRLGGYLWIIFICSSSNYKLQTRSSLINGSVHWDQQGPVENETVGPLFHKSLRISRWHQQSTKPVPSQSRALWRCTGHRPEAGPTRHFIHNILQLNKISVRGSHRRFIDWHSLTLNREVTFVGWQCL